MALIKGRFKDIELAEDASSVKVRLHDGTAVLMDIPDFLDFSKRILDAGITIQVDQATNKRGVSTRYASVPLSLQVEEFNAAIPQTNQGMLLIETVYDRGHRLILGIRPELVGFLQEAMRRWQSRDTGRPPEVH